eukprot:TRINITY_DN1610_c0_g1_i1.p1 TRINITY_DN1610_c0_g1~~TRINITY_DN1610_c0_g1_i1.p1  ORF type:complete len:467 (-),score=23.64 TRINITY_DN1610_c0_g1_i1:209-1609(-)
MTVALPLRTIPGSYGLPLIGPLKDRLDYFWFEGADTFFRNRVAKHKSTVFRTNVPPTFPFFLGVNPQVIAVTDTSAFSTLFDISLVEKKNILVGDFMPSVAFTGNTRVLAYLDPSEPKHSAVKNFVMDRLKKSSETWVTEFLNSLDDMWATIEKDVAQNGSSSFQLPLQKCLFSFLCKSFIGADPASTPDIAENGYIMLNKWLALQLLPTTKVGVLPQPLEEILLHSFAFPFALVSGDYKKLYEFLEEQGKEVIEIGMRDYNLAKEEIIHNLLFVLGFNAFGGFSLFFSTLISTLGSDKGDLQARLREEVKKNGNSGALNFQSLTKMDLIKSTVYELLRLNPPVPLQYARARKDFVMSTEDYAYQVRKGELLCGYQPLAMRDPKVFDEPEEFVADRFSEQKGKELLSYLFWSNGPQTAEPSASNKQCAAKDVVVGTAGLMVADIFTRYKSFKCDETSLAITAIEKA